MVIVRWRHCKIAVAVLLMGLVGAIFFKPCWAEDGTGAFCLIPDGLDLSNPTCGPESPIVLAQAETKTSSDFESDSGWGDESVVPAEMEEEKVRGISDPLEPINRIFFAFNDKLYFWLLEPVAKGYSKVVPEPARVGVRNFFSNLLTPIRLVNCLLQGKFKSAGTETLRFIINSTVGFLGFQDVAKQEGHLERQEEDLGQSLGVYGLGPGIYINWPIFGPSSFRDTVGMFGDFFLDPINYAVTRTKYNMAVKGYDKVNKTSLTLGDYESLKKAALDPYVAVRDAYFQYRRNLIKK